MAPDPAIQDEYIPSSRYVVATLADRPPKPVGRRWRLPLILFVATCLSVFWAGATHWIPTYYLFGAESPFPSVCVIGPPSIRRPGDRWQGNLLEESPGST